MDKVIKLTEQNPLSTEEIVNLCKGQVNILTYRDLSQMKTIDSALKPWNCAIVLVETKDHFGHWIAILKYKQDKEGHTIPDDSEGGKWVIEVFDSYGMKPDDELKFVPEHMKEKLGADYRYLTDLLYRSGYPVIYNKIPLQELKGNVSTCGRWCGLRVNFRNIDLGKFCKVFINQKMKPDEIITYLTSFIDNKRPEQFLNKGGRFVKEKGGRYPIMNKFPTPLPDFLVDLKCPTCVH